MTRDEYLALSPEEQKKYVKKSREDALKELEKAWDTYPGGKRWTPNYDEPKSPSIEVKEIF